ncbi:extracellular solute-binding protein [Fusibacter paucivorans]|uniref:Extracellular solute-binding protein n=1 Tax=Fusibacter paucivorans TaxID=76009 RepID=A0ABS5PK21_9FIRM|nr:extracellular solute-binding protein [Fusibacter paucivorans]MBS7525341.1 extracellular solute-binding protein [Fusibacter paucivorans]
MKKLMILLCLMLIMLAALAGCSQNSATASDNVNKAEAPSMTQSSGDDNESDGPVEIEFWHALGGSLGDGLQAIIDDYNASQSQYVIEPVVVGSYSEIDEKLQAAYAAKNVPALVVGGSQEMFYQKGLVESFEDYMPSNFYKSDLVGGFLTAATKDGKLVFAPAYGTSQVLYYNKAVLEAAALDTSVLENWNSVAGMHDSVKGIDTGVDSIEYAWEPMWGSGNIIDMASSNGAAFISEDGKTVTINSEAWVDVLEQVRIWLHDDQCMAIHSGGQGWEYWYKTMDDWVYGKAVGYTGSPGDYTIALDAVKKANEEGYTNTFAVTHQPGWGDNDPAPFFSSLMYFIPKGDNLTEAQKKGAADFVSFAINTQNTADFSMATGYVAVRKSVLSLPEYQTYLESNPDADAALKQIDQYAVPEFIDPTGGAILSALSDAVDKVEIENISAKEALDEAQAKAQRELDKIN